MVRLHEVPDGLPVKYSKLKRTHYKHCVDDFEHHPLIISKNAK